jgi:hypothetical protein
MSGLPAPAELLPDAFTFEVRFEDLGFSSGVIRFLAFREGQLAGILCCGSEAPEAVCG